MLILGQSDHKVLLVQKCNRIESLFKILTCEVCCESEQSEGVFWGKSATG